MATKSFLKEVEIKDKKLGQSFAYALDVAIEKADKTNTNPINREHIELSGEEIEDFFSV